MPKIRKLPDVLKENPDFRPGWSVLEENLPDGKPMVTSIEHQIYGEVERVVVCRDDGTPLWDQYQIKERPGCVIVPYFQKDRVYVGLITRIRELVMDPETGGQGNCPSLELPRGFSKGAEHEDEGVKRELYEETTRVAKSLHRLGKVNPNTAFYITPGVPVFAAEVEPSETNEFKPKCEEAILRCEFLPYEEVQNKIRNQEIYCGFTLAALMLFDTYLESLPTE